MTINQRIELYNSIWQGKEVILNANNPKAMSIVSSDGTNCLIDGIPVCTTIHQKEQLDHIIEKCELAKEFAEHIGEDTTNMFDEYQLVYDSLDGMTLLSRIELSRIVFIYLTRSYSIVEQIDKNTGVMIYNRFWLDSGKMNHNSMRGILSSKSRQALREIKKRSITQNFYYDMLFDGMTSYSEMLNAGIPCETPNITRDAILKKWFM